MAKLPVEILTPAEVQALLGGCSPRCPTGARNRAMIALLWRAGLRIGETLALVPKDIDEANSTVRILRGKGGKARTVGLDPQAFAMLALWLEKRKEFANGKHRVFCTLDAKPLASAYCRNLFKRLGRKARIEKRVHPHGLRHTHASELSREGVEIRIISKQLGHSNIATTARYIDHVSPKEVIETIKARTW